MADAPAKHGGIVLVQCLEPDLGELRVSLARFGVEASQFEAALPLESVTLLGVAPDASTSCSCAWAAPTAVDG